MVRHEEQQFRCWNFKFWQCDLVKCHVIKDWWIARLMLNAIEPNKLWLQRSNVSAPGKTDVKVIVQCLCPRKDRCVLSLPWAKHMFLWKWLCNVSGPGKIVVVMEERLFLNFCDDSVEHNQEVWMPNKMADD
jgi:hypothetical protein